MKLRDAICKPRFIVHRSNKRWIVVNEDKVTIASFNDELLAQEYCEWKNNQDNAIIKDVRKDLEQIIIAWGRIDVGVEGVSGLVNKIIDMNI